jgi:hypothetical protein
MYARALPYVGQSVTVSFLAARVHGTVVAVNADLAGLDVLTEEDDVIKFLLQPTTGRFQAAGQSGARLFFNTE